MRDGMRRDDELSATGAAPKAIRRLRRSTGPTHARAVSDSLGHAVLAQQAPHPYAGNRDIDVANAEVPHRFGDRGRRSDDRRLADALGAERVVRRRAGSFR